eukprot:CAMPEP_0179167910 /NCGR_PEP_ID=MMETSP0796-20121207/82580_1 /TAXON_ID=73915 /ORGANISM="Pyrodinium bahamense, Strain pbaha01" /LENGTH=228 /DNA_ID=CAMNT_0020870649 /DNA_START=152 /DNA_END=835 /DNA_ORIENTATION=-
MPVQACAARSGEMGTTASAVAAWAVDPCLCSGCGKGAVSPAAQRGAGAKTGWVLTSNSRHPADAASGWSGSTTYRPAGKAPVASTGTSCGWASGHSASCPLGAAGDAGVETAAMGAAAAAAAEGSSTASPESRSLWEDCRTMRGVPRPGLDAGDASHGAPPAGSGPQASPGRSAMLTTGAMRGRGTRVRSHGRSGEASPPFAGTPPPVPEGCSSGAPVAGFGTVSSRR